MFKLALNAGHGFETAGKRCLKSIDPAETREYVLNSRIADKVEQKLKAIGGVEILRIDNGTDISISRRAAAANAFGADFYLAVHHNAGIGGQSGGGVEVYVYLKVDSETTNWQKEIYDCVIEKTGLRGNRANPLRAADFGECRETAMPAVLIECGYMDSTVDTPIILTDEFAEKCADGLVAAVVSHWGLKATPEKAPAAPPQNGKKTVEELAKEVINGLWANGEARKINLTDAGYDYAAVQKRVNEILLPKAGKTTDQIAKEVINGDWGNGEERKQKLSAAGYDYQTVQKRVNEMLK